MICQTPVDVAIPICCMCHSENVLPGEELCTFCLGAAEHGESKEVA